MQRTARQRRLPLDRQLQTGFVTPDPAVAYTLTAAQRTELVDLMELRAYGRPRGLRPGPPLPRHRPRGQSLRQARPPPQRGPRPRPAPPPRRRHDPDAFTFGTSLRRLCREAVIGAVPGVLGVREIRIAARSFHLVRTLEPRYEVPLNQILRLASDPRKPERGSLIVLTEGCV